MLRCVPDCPDPSSSSSRSTPKPCPKRFIGAAERRNEHFRAGFSSKHRPSQIDLASRRAATSLTCSPCGSSCRHSYPTSSQRPGHGTDTTAKRVLRSVRNFNPPKQQHGQTDPSSQFRSAQRLSYVQSLLSQAGAPVTGNGGRSTVRAGAQVAWRWKHEASQECAAAEESRCSCSLLSFGRRNL